MSRYTPPTSFKDVELAEVTPFVGARPLATIVGIGPAGLITAHVPVLLAGTRLEGHVAATNASFAALEGEISAVAMFQREQDYGLPEEARMPADEVFGAVHLHGRLRRVDDFDFRLANIEALSQNSLAGRIHPWAAPDLPRAFTEVLAKKTVGLVFEIDRAQASHAYLRHGQGRTDGLVDMDPREFTSPNCRPTGA
jgi:transcriptional regulator